MSGSKIPRKFGFGSRGRSQSGQAIIEYLLVVFISVVIIATLLVKLYGPMNTFISSVMGTYVECLLETGQLPKLGSSDDIGECKIFQFDPGAPSGTDTAGNSKGKKDSSDKNDSKNDSEDKDSSSKARRGAGGDGGGGRGSRRASYAMKGPQAGTAGVDGGKRGGGVEIALENGGAGAGFFGNSRGGYRRRDRYRTIGGMGWTEEERKTKEAKDRAITVSGKPEDIVGGTRPRKVAMIRPDDKQKLLEDVQPGSLDIGYIVKIILISAIILVLLLLIGGQAMQLSKSWEKAE